ncbi:hypothetical protein [Eikenella corrodens]|nr:hypothetical protein [Eikenella corrodens]
MKPLLSILSISLLAACSNPTESIQQAPLCARTCTEHRLHPRSRSNARRR